jgi:hypothetical protein
VAQNDAGFANSGIQYRSIERPDFVVAGYQADLEAGPVYSGILYDEAGGAGGRGIMASRGEIVRWTREATKQVVGQLEPTDVPIRQDDWNEYVIVARGNRLQHFINGVQTIDVVDDSPSQRLMSGVLALQLHAGEPMTVQFKDIRIRSLSAADAIGGGNLNVANGFQLELLYTVPKETEGSWVAMCVDPKGRLIVGDQNGQLYRIQLPAVGQVGVIRPEPIELDIGDIGGAHGLLYAFDSLYVMVNERDERGMYRVRDTDGDDRFDQVQLLRRLPGAGEHGVHTMVVSPDGKWSLSAATRPARLSLTDHAYPSTGAKTIWWSGFRPGLWTIHSRRRAGLP